MYGIERKISMNTNVVKSREKVEPIVKNNPHIFKSNGLGKYKYPNCYEIPAGKYFSKVTNVKFSQTRTGEEAIDVYYEIRDGKTCYDIANGIIPADTKNDPYYIKQKYPETSKYYDMFVDSMSEALEKEEFEYEEVIGVTEFVKLEYDKSDIGGFTERTPLEWDDFIIQTKDE